MSSFCRNPVAADFPLTVSSVSWLCDTQTLHRQVSHKVLDQIIDCMVLCINIAIKIE